LGKEYYDCPTRCPKNRIREYDVRRDILCKECPRIYHRNKFRQSTENEWDKWFDEEDQARVEAMGYERLLQLVQMVRNCPEDIGYIDVGSSHLVNIYRQENDRYDDIVRERVTNA
jgi:hypothetical protein